MISFFNTILAVGTIALQIALFATIISWISGGHIHIWVSKHVSLILRVLFVGSALASLTYEFGFGYAPCLLCWYQRMAIFPLAILLLTAHITKSALLRTQTIILSTAGLLVALFHNYLDIFPSSGLDTCGEGPSCLIRYVYEFGYITIPMMSATLLVTGIVLTLLARRYPQA